MSPPIAIVEGDTFINETYTTMVSLIKQTQGTIKYKLRMTSKSHPFLKVQLTNSKGATLTCLGDVIEGEVLEEGASDFEIELSCSECGPAEALFYIEIEDGSPLSFSCQANFRGPIVRLKDTVIDFGLAKVNTSHHRVITIENECPIPASLIIKNFKNKSMTFENALNGESVEIN